MKKIIGIFVCTLLIATTIPVVGQVDIFIEKENNETSPLSNGDIWMKTYGGNKFDMGTYVTETSDGGYIVVGATSSFGAGLEDVWLLKTDYQGMREWEKFFGGEYEDFGADVQQTTDGGYIITGSTESFGNGKADVWLIKTDADGEKLWDKTFGDFNFDRGHSIRETNDGGYIILGIADHTGGPRGDVWLIKTDGNGEKLWDQKFGGKGHNGGSSIDFTSDGGYIIVGSSYVSGETDSYDLWLIKTDGNGEMLWDKKFNGDGSDHGNGVQETTDGGFIICGTTGYDHPYSNIWIIKTDSNGEILWDKVISEFADDQRGVSVRQTVDGGFILVGEILLDNIFGFDPLLIKTNNAGEEEWSHHITEFGNDVIFSVEQTIDEGYIFTGYRTSGLKTDLWLIKANSDGEIPTCRPRNLWKSRIFELFPNLVRIFQSFNLGRY